MKKEELFIKSSFSFLCEKRIMRGIDTEMKDKCEKKRRSNIYIYIVVILLSIIGASLVVLFWEYIPLWFPVLGIICYFTITIAAMLPEGKWRDFIRHQVPGKLLYLIHGGLFLAVLLFQFLSLILKLTSTSNAIIDKLYLLKNHWLFLSLLFVQAISLIGILFRITFRRLPAILLGISFFLAVMGAVAVYARSLNPPEYLQELGQRLEKVPAQVTGSAILVAVSPLFVTIARRIYAHKTNKYKSEEITNLAKTQRKLILRSFPCRILKDYSIFVLSVFFGALCVIALLINLPKVKSETEATNLSVTARQESNEQLVHIDGKIWNSKETNEAAAEGANNQEAASKLLLIFAIIASGLSLFSILLLLESDDTTLMKSEYYYVLYRASLNLDQEELRDYCQVLAYLYCNDNQIESNNVYYHDIRGAIQQVFKGISEPKQKAKFLTMLMNSFFYAIEVFKKEKEKHAESDSLSAVWTPTSAEVRFSQRIGEYLRLAKEAQTTDDPMTGSCAVIEALYNCQLQFEDAINYSSEHALSAFWGDKGFFGIPNAGQEKLIELEILKRIAVWQRKNDGCSFAHFCKNAKKCTQNPPRYFEKTLYLLYPFYAMEVIYDKLIKPIMPSNVSDSVSHEKELMGRARAALTLLYTDTIYYAHHVNRPEATAAEKKTLAKDLQQYINNIGDSEFKRVLCSCMEEIPLAFNSLPDLYREQHLIEIQGRVPPSIYEQVSLRACENAVEIQYQSSSGH